MQVSTNFIEQEAPADIITQVEVAHFKVFWRKDRVLEVHCKNDFIYEPQHLKEFLAAVGKLTNEKRVIQLFIAGQTTTISKDSREFMNTPESNKYSIAEAYVIHSLAQRIIANFFMKAYKLDVPVRFFNQKKAAEEWLMQFRESG